MHLKCKNRVILMRENTLAEFGRLLQHGRLISGTSLTPYANFAMRPELKAESLPPLP